ncbi:GlxA family transcriptional regulator [Rhodococcoides kyotonense]|uniref:Transcriptional regulator GlxA family, contains an amidase domain and an AraC-type DNA-binding HTH domain n=1 Tax=Rhodococcoides kyotonense TaxID=398843 RepID=A0A239N777_9NOCA|nr:helix-turn-helix domain-containing protein [Rhodococcus kyotonensis]SNT50332.1 Transcriptional regulator GlxA family, contains an amidase domain and an AraC-type DNA-binding HTH domain [Rhodococcus kyotonensis]
MHTVVVFVRDGLLGMEFGSVHRLFGQATSDNGDKLYDVVTCTTTPGPVRTDADVPIHVSRGLDALADADTVIVPASDLDYGPNPLADTAFLENVPKGARIASICTGAFVLAAAGLLDGRRATTHWASVNQFRALYPQVLLEPNVLYTHDGTVLTAAGEASGIDLCLYMIRHDFGAAVANRVARGTVVPPHRSGGQAQYIATPVPRAKASSIAAAQDWALGNLHQPLSISALAGVQAMSVRTFTRRFTAEVGVSPAKWIASQRLRRAQELLENTDHTIDRVAAEAGFGTATSMRQQMMAEIGVSPSAYRATWNAPPAPVRA